MELSEEQQRFINLACEGHNIFLTGCAGCGKSAVISKFVEVAGKSKNIVLTATTGKAAILVNGSTVHRFIGRGLLEFESIDMMISDITNVVHSKIVYRDLIKRINCTDVLVIDEVSMLNTHVFYYLDMLAREIRKNNRPFGGIQLILVGDFAQCEPVQRKRIVGARQTTLPGTKPHPAFTEKFVFKTPLWTEAITKQVILTKSFRQPNDEYFALLFRLRHNKLTQDDIALLKSRVGPNLNNAPTCFYRNDRVAQVNKQMYDDLPGPEHVFTARYGVVRKVVTNTGVRFEKDTSLRLNKDVMDKYIKQFTEQAPISTEIKLKPNTVVLLKKNLDVENGLSNGTVAKIACMKLFKSAFNGCERMFPVIKYTHDKSEKEVLLTDKPAFMIPIKDDYFFAMYQIPVCYGWSVTIHNTQGSTMNMLHGSTEEIPPNACGGLVYVMLSRVKSLSCITFSKFDEKTIHISPEVIEFEQQLLLESN